ncbi:trypsin alpha-like [Drosophila eugracilis]|uniref:trypsin alpha-like n=1 Tax=Drosophila eugracilis TaxID=29029 RepID=UPI001BDAA5DE|nr:trypsin alpha-like [Drosophila eugracilis]
MFIRCFLLLWIFNFLSAGRVPQPEERIIGGGPIEIEQSPWQVSLQVEGVYICGGSIYSKDIIITAAHCTEKEDKQLEAKDFLVRAGSALKNSGGTLSKVATLILHEEYHSKNLLNDIAIMRLSQPLELSHKVQTIPLAERYPVPGTIAFTSGSGEALDEDGTPIGPIKLQGTFLRIQPLHTCTNLFFTRRDLICAGSSGQTACIGDSGGPLIVDQKLVGVTSFQGCIDPTLFANVPYFRKWILDTINYI